MATLEQLLCDKTVLVVEDEVLISSYLNDLLTDLGCRAVIDAQDVDSAAAQLQTHTSDLAILDLRLRSARFSYPIAEILKARNIPFVFATGFASGSTRCSHHSTRCRPDSPDSARPVKKIGWPAGNFSGAWSM